MPGRLVSTLFLLTTRFSPIKQSLETLFLNKEHPWLLLLLLEISFTFSCSTWVKDQSLWTHLYRSQCYHHDRGYLPDVVKLMAAVLFWQLWGPTFLFKPRFLVLCRGSCLWCIVYWNQYLLLRYVVSLGASLCARHPSFGHVCPCSLSDSELQPLITISPLQTTLEHGVHWLLSILGFLLCPCLLLKAQPLWFGPLFCSCSVEVFIISVLVLDTSTLTGNHLGLVCRVFQGSAITTNPESGFIRSINANWENSRVNWSERSTLTKWDWHDMEVEKSVKGIYEVIYSTFELKTFEQI